MPQPAIGGPGSICLPTSSHLGQSGEDVAGLPMQDNHSDCSRVAQHALFLGSSGNVKPNPTEPAQPAKHAHFASQPDSSQDLSHLNLHAWLLEPQQCSSEAVATQIEAPQRGSTRSVYVAKGAIFTKWCLSNQVDFRAPPKKSVADFFMYLFQDRKLQPSTIDGYRSSIADKLGNSSINISITGPAGVLHRMTFAVIWQGLLRRLVNQLSIG